MVMCELAMLEGLAFASVRSMSSSSAQIAVGCLQQQHSLSYLSLAITLQYVWQCVAFLACVDALPN